MAVRSSMRWVGLLFGVFALGVGGCGSLSGGGKSQSALLAKPAPTIAVEEHTPALVAAALPAEPPAAEAAPNPEAAGQPNPAALLPADAAPAPAAVAASEEASPPLMVAQRRAGEPLPDGQIEEYDPWEKFNEKMFTFNYNFDKYALKPVAKGYNVVMPDMFQQMIGNGFDNINVVPKLANNLLQRNWKGFGTEMGRFLINSTFGIGGLFDMAKQEFGLEKTKVDFGQTLGKWGFTPGPYLILPFLPPLTVRDGIGYAVDGAMDPLSYVLPFIWDRLGMRIGDTVNDRSLNLDLFQGFEETTVDLYSAVRNGYLQRRYNLIHGSSP